MRVQEDPGAEIVVLEDDSRCDVSFNVMPGRKVTEALSMRRYVIGADFIEAEFDRTYISEMLNSPTHLTFIAACIQGQKCAYVYCCHRFGLDPSPSGAEKLKIWPTHVQISMPKMVVEETGLRHRFELVDLRKVEEGKYFGRFRTHVDGILTINFGAIIQLLVEPPAEPESTAATNPTNQPPK